MDRSENMRRIKSVDTVPEMIVRRLVRSLGYRYRLHSSDLPGKPDLAFRKRKKAILVHGCFWHQHDNAECKLSHRPKSNRGYWDEKLKRNKRRDKANLNAFHSLGWSVLVLWECETREKKGLERKIVGFLGATRP